MKPVVAIIAHPDDETTMSGTLAKMSKQRDVYIVCATSGDAGENHHHNKKEPLMFIREDELRTSAKVLGVKHVSFLGFNDGSLCNNFYHDLAKKIENKVRQWEPDTLITFEPRGISGHIDHIAVSMVTAYLYERLPFVKKLLYACMSYEQRKVLKKLSSYFIYFPQGYKKDEVDDIVDVSDVVDKKIAVLKSHKSQKKDVETIMLPILEKAPKEEYFIVLKKS